MTIIKRLAASGAAVAMLAGGALAVAPAAQAQVSVQKTSHCTNLLKDLGYTVNNKMIDACAAHFKDKSVFGYTICLSGLMGQGVKPNHAEIACQQAPKK